MPAFVTLDGVVQGPGGPQEDVSDAFGHGGWIVPFFDEKFGEFMVRVFARASAFLIGRGTYQIFACHWPRVTDPNDPIAVALNEPTTAILTDRPPYLVSGPDYGLTQDAPPGLTTRHTRPPNVQSVLSQSNTALLSMMIGTVLQLRTTFPSHWERFAVQISTTSKQAAGVAGSSKHIAFGTCAPQNVLVHRNV